MVSNWLLKQREFWLYNKVKKELSKKEINKTSFTITNNSFTYMRNIKKGEFGGMTYRFPNIISLLINSLFNPIQKNEGVSFQRYEAKSTDMMFVGPAIPGEEAYVYHLNINIK